jgi:hypothetical protein
VLYIITIGILDQEICAQKWFSTNFYVATHFEEMGVWALEHSFLLAD